MKEGYCYFIISSRSILLSDGKKNIGEMNLDKDSGKEGVRIRLDASFPPMALLMIMRNCRF